MPCLRVDFAFLYASRSRGSPFQRVNLCRTVRHFQRRTDKWWFHQYIESPVRPCPRRGMEWSHAATTFRLTAGTVSSNDPADPAQPSSSMSLVSSRCSPSLSLLSRFVFQEGLLTFPPLPVFTGWLRSWMLNLMHWWSLNVINSRTHQSPILEARRGAAIVRSIIDPPAPRLNVSSLPRFNTIRSFLATISPTKIPLLSKRASPHSGDLLLKSPAIRERPLTSLRLSLRRRIWFSKISKGSLAEK